MKKITLLVFVMMCFTVSAQKFDLTSLPYTNNSSVSYDGSTKTISWKAAGGTGAMGYVYESGSYLDGSSQKYLNVIIKSVTGDLASCRIYYSDGSNETTNLTTTSAKKVYNIMLDPTKKSAIAQIEFRLYGGAPTTVTIEDMYLSPTAATF